MIKVCYIISSLSNQGPPNVLYNIIQYMDFKTFDVSIITMVNEQEISRLEEFKKLPIKVVQMSPDRAQNPLAMFLTLKKAVEIINPDILHTHCPRSLFLVPFLPKKYKKVMTAHIFPGIQQRVLYGNKKGTIVIALSHFFTKRMDLPIACSESVADSYWEEQKYKMIAIPNGASVPVWSRDKQEKIALRKKLGLKENVKYFIFIGRFSKEKRPDLIIKAFQELQLTDVGVILLGHGDLYDELIKQQSDLILLPGFKTNIEEYLKASDYYISASDVEGLANTLLESMAIGLPSVLSDIPSHREVVNKSTNKIGLLFNNKKIDSLKDSIKEIITCNTESTAAQIQQLFSSYYSAKNMSQKYQDEYIKLTRND